MSTDTDDVSWIQWFCSLRGNEFLVEVDEDYIHDKFNLTGLNEQVPHYRWAIQSILDEDVDDLDAASSKRTPSDLIEQAAELLYGLIHARYILSPAGLDAMVQKLKANGFGHCPRVFCTQTPMIPIGLSDIPGEGTVKLYCPKCNDVYAPKLTRHKGTDGAFFGTGFPHMLLMVYPEFRPAPPETSFTPKLYGFKIHPEAAEIQLKKGLDKIAATRPNPKAGKL